MVLLRRSGYACGCMICRLQAAIFVVVGWRMAEARRWPAQLGLHCKGINIQTDSRGVPSLDKERC